MKPRFFGDAKDLYKRGFLSLVQSSCPVRGPKVLPMFTDECKDADVAAYSKILGITELSIISRKQFFPRRGRKEYFEAGLATHYLGEDLFLDPDCGLVADLCRKQRDREVVTFNEAACLLPVKSDRVLMIYDESVNMANRAKAMFEKLDALRSKALASFAYFNSSPNHPNIVFIANNSGQSRLTNFRSALLGVGIPPTKFLSLQ